MKTQAANVRRRGAMFVAALLGCGAAASTHAAFGDDREAMRRACPGFVAYLERQQATAVTPPLPPIPPAPPTDPSLREHLLRMQADDQAARALAMTSVDPGEDVVRRITEVDARNLLDLRVILASGGMPTSERVGDDGASAAWLLVQHADADPALQALALERIEARAGGGESNGAEVAMLTDRVLLAQGKPQRYGSQFAIQHGVQTLRPTEDMPGLDRRRNEMGLAPLADYACVLRAVYGMH